MTLKQMMPRLPPHFWRRLRNTLGDTRRKRAATIDTSTEGFVFAFRRKQVAMRWADIVRIDAGIRDCLTYDAVFVRMFTDQNSVHIEELDDGFRQFEHELLARWPQIRESWDSFLKAEAFTARLETLWQR